MFDIIFQKRFEINKRVINSFWFVCFQKLGLGYNMLDFLVLLKRGKERENFKLKKFSFFKKVRFYFFFIECYVIEIKKMLKFIKKK